MEADIGMDAVVVLLCGLPGAGKSTLATHFVVRQNGSSATHAHAPGSARRMRFERVCFDQMLVDRSAESGFEAEIWKATQMEMAALTRSRLQEHRKSGTDECLVLVVDDNFHYRSQRKRFYHIAAQERCGFGIVHVKASDELCRARNAARRGAARVPQKPLERMLETFEDPDPAIFTHEQNVVTVDNGMDGPAVSAMDMAVFTVVSEAARKWKDAHAAAAAEAKRLDQQVADQQLTARSVEHHVDLALRRWISSVLQAGGENASAFQATTKAEKSALAQFLNRQRKAFLLELKSRHARTSGSSCGQMHELLPEFQERAARNFSRNSCDN